MSQPELLSQYGQIADIQKLAEYEEKLKLIDVEIEKLEHKIKELKNVKETVFSEYMVDAMGDNEEVIIDGSRFVLYYDIKPTLKQERLKDLLDYLNSIGMSDVVTHSIAVADKGEMGNEIIKEVQAYLNKQGIDFKRKVDIHKQTLQKMCRDLMEEGEQIPPELISVFQKRKVKILKKRR